LGDTGLSLHRTGDGLACACHTTAAIGHPRGRVVLLHGLRSHAGWYTATRTQLSAAGYEVAFLDRRGAGLNTAQRGDTPSFHRLIADVAEVIRELKRTRNSLPLVLAGISWGGKLALGVAAAHPRLVDGVALLCPGLVARVQPPFTTRLRIALARFLRPTRRFPIPLNAPELFTASPLWQQFIAHDPHGLTEATARFLFESVRFDLHLKRRVKRVACPVLLMLAGRDRILDNPATRRYLARLTNARSIHVVDYPGVHHTLEFEDAAYLPELLRWMEQV